MMRGRGYFNAHWIYEQVGLPTGIMPLTLLLSAKSCNTAYRSFERESGKLIY